MRAAVFLRFTVLVAESEVVELPVLVRVWVCCLWGPLLSVVAVWLFGAMLFPGSSPGLLMLVLLLFWLPHGLSFPMLFFQNVVDKPSGAAVRRHILLLSLVGVAVAALGVPCLY